MIEHVLWGDYQQQSSTPSATVLIDLASNWLRCFSQLVRKAVPWPTGCTLVWPDSGEQRKFQSFSSSAFVSLSRHDYDELTPEVSKGLFLTAPLSSSKAIKGSKRNRKAATQGLVAKRTRKLEGCILKSRWKIREKHIKKQQTNTISLHSNFWVKTRLTAGWLQPTFVHPAAVIPRDSWVPSSAARQLQWQCDTLTWQDFAKQLSEESRGSSAPRGKQHI